MRFSGLFWVVLLAAPCAAQPGCQPTPLYSPCELVFELNDAEAASHPTPYSSVELRAEMRSPRHRTFLMPAFWDGGRKLVVRFAPVDEGEWNFRITSNIKRFDGMQGTFSATASDVPGHVQVANLQHWAWSNGKRPHLWMGDTSYRFATVPQAFFDQLLAKRAEQKFNHLRGHATGTAADAERVFADPARPDVRFFQQVDERVRALNAKGIVVDLILGHDQNHLRKLFPNAQARERYLRYMVARYSAFVVTWQLVQEFEEYEDGRALCKELGLALKRLDPYQHPRTTHTLASSASLNDDGWQDYISYQSSDIDLGAIEKQLYTRPAVNAEFGYEDSGAGRSHSHHVDSNEFRHRLWNATMNGHYPTFGNTGVYGGAKVTQDPKYFDSPGAGYMKVWFELFDKTRHWELEPYFDLDGGRAVALPDVEYIVYVEKPSGPIEVRVERHGYDVAWIDPATGERTPLKDWKGDKFVGEPPSRDHDWVLHISREGRKEGMLRSYKFESRPVLKPEVEPPNPRTPYAIAEPAPDTLQLSKPSKYAVRLKRETRGTRSMQYLWTVENTVEGTGYRVAGTGPAGTLRIPRSIAKKLPAVLNLRVTGMNANGKVYFVDKVVTLTE